MAQDYELREIFDISKFTVVGSPTITDDGIASGFSGSNYINAQPFSATSNTDFEIITSFKVSSFPSSASKSIFRVATNNYMGSFGFSLKIDNLGRIGLSGVWSTDTFYSSLSANVFYTVKVKVNNGVASLYLNDTLLNSSAYTKNIASAYLTLGTGSATDYLEGSIDLNAFKVYVDNQEVFKGTKTVVAKIPPETISGQSSVPMDYAAALEELENYYANLLIIQYHNKPKAIGMIKSLVRALFADMILFKVRDGFNIVNQPYAVGKQLDCIGEWVGVDRIYDAGQPLYPWYSYVDWEQTTTDPYQGGFQDWNDPIVEDGGFLGFDDLIMGANKTALADDLYLSLIKLKIIKNSSTHTMGDLDRKLYQYFGSDIYLTWSGMEMTYNYVNKYNALMEISQIKNALPIPNGSIVHLNPL